MNKEIHIEEATNGYIVDCGSEKQVCKTLDEVFTIQLAWFEGRKESGDYADNYGKVVVYRNKEITDEMMKALHGMNIADTSVGAGKTSNLLKTDVIDFGEKGAVDKIKEVEKQKNEKQT